jgi:ferredoxin
MLLALPVSIPGAGHARAQEDQMTRDAPQPARPPATTSFHIVVDLNRCQAYAQCCFLAPDVFQLHGEETLWYDPGPDEAQREHVLRAAAACPVQAIIVEAPGAVSRQRRKHNGHVTHRKQREEPHAAQRA